MPHTGKPLVRSPAVRYSGSVRQGQQQQQKQQQRQQRGASVTSGNVIRVASSSAVTGKWARLVCMSALCECVLYVRLSVICVCVRSLMCERVCVCVSSDL